MGSGGKEFFTEEEIEKLLPMNREGGFTIEPPMHHSVCVPSAAGSYSAPLPSLTAANFTLLDCAREPKSDRRLAFQLTAWCCLLGL